MSSSVAQHPELATPLKKFVRDWMLMLVEPFLTRYITPR